MFLASLYIPVIVLKARKFVLLFSLGSLFFIFRFDSNLLIIQTLITIFVVV